MHSRTWITGCLRERPLRPFFLAIFLEQQPMAKAPTILVTGSAGRIGKAVVRELRARGHSVRGYDIVASPQADEYVVGSTTDAESVGRAVPGIETVIHLAATPDDDDFLTKLLPNNI